MAFTLNSVVRIGAYSFVGGINEVVIKKNVHIIVDTATLKIPGKCNVASGSVDDNLKHPIPKGPKHIIKSFPSGFNTAEIFQQGDPVSIYLGYNGDLKNEFQGFVRRVNQTNPITIELEGYAWQLRNQNILASWKVTTLKQVLQRIIQGTDIVLSPDIPDMPMTNYRIPNRSGLDVLEDLKIKKLLTVYFADNVLYAGIEEGRTTTGTDGVKTLTGIAPVTYSIGINCITNQPDLKMRLGKDNLVRVRLTVSTNKGHRTLYEAGDVGGAIHEVRMENFRDAQNLKDLSAAKLKRLKYDGFEGKITGFLQPYCQPGWKAIIKDKAYNNARAGTYFIPGTTVTFGVKGATRSVEIGYRLDTPQTATTTNNLTIK